MFMGSRRDPFSLENSGFQPSNRCNRHPFPSSTKHTVALFGERRKGGKRKNLANFSGGRGSLVIGHWGEVSADCADGERGHWSFVIGHWWEVDVGGGQETGIQESGVRMEATLV